MSETQTQTAAELNAATDASLSARRAPAAKPTVRKPAARKPAAKTAPKTAPKAATPARTVAPKAAPKVRKAMTPRERAAKPVTATIASYVEWLNATVFDGKLSAAQKSAAGVSITLYGAYQSSPERKAARG